MNNQTNNLPVCTFCKEPMEEGYIWLAAQNAELRWQIEKPSLSAWRFWSMSQGEKLLVSNARHFPKTLRQAYRCIECDCLTIQSISKQLSALNSI